MSIEVNHIEEGSSAHILLVESLPAFYEWQDAGFLLHTDYEEKARALKRLIDDFTLARREYLNRLK